MRSSSMPGALVPALDGARALAHRAVRRVRVAWTGLVRRLRSRTPEQVLWVFLAVILTLYVVILFTASTGTGRGGR